MAIIAPLLIAVARQVATRYLARSAATRLAAGAAAGPLSRAALSLRNAGQTPFMQRPIPSYIPGLRSIVNQPRLFNWPAITPTARAARAAGTRPQTLFSRNLQVPTGQTVSTPVTITRLRQPVRLPSGATVTRLNQPYRTTAQTPVMRNVGAAERVARAAASPIRAASQMSRPVDVAQGLEFSAYAAALGAGTSGFVPNPTTSSTPGSIRPIQATPGVTPFAPPTPTAPGAVTPFVPPTPAAPSAVTPFVPPSASTPPAQSAPGQRIPGNQPTTLQPNQPGRVWEPPRSVAPPSVAPSAPPAPTVPGPQDSVNAADQNAANLQAEISRINGVYNGLVNDIKKMYQLAPTEEEKELLRSDLADLEAEHEAAKLAAATLFSEKDQTIKAIAAKSRSMTTERAQGVGSLYSNAALDLEALDAARRSQVAEGARGSGYGAAVARDANIDAELLATLAPIAQTYTQDIGDIGAQGIDYLAGLNQAMEAARASELQSRYAGARQAIRGDWMQTTADRIANERLELASQMGSLAERQLATQASLGRSGSSEATGPTAADYWDQIEALASSPGLTDQQFSNWWMRFFGTAPTQDDYDAFVALRDYYNEQDMLSQQSSQPSYMSVFPGMSASEALAAFNELTPEQQALALSMINGQ